MNIVEVIVLICLSGFCASGVLGYGLGAKQWTAIYGRRRHVDFKMTSTSPDYVTQNVLLRTVGMDQFTLVQPSMKQSSKTQDVRTIYSVSLVDNKGAAVINAKIGHKTTGPVPRSAAPSMLVLEQSSGTERAKIDENAIFSLVEECLRWYLDAGGRIGKLIINLRGAVKEDNQLQSAISKMGFAATDTLPQLGLISQSYFSTEQAFSLQSTDISSSSYYISDGRGLVAFIQTRLQPSTSTSSSQPSGSSNSDSYTLHNVLGRLYHDLGDPKSSIQAYTNALIVNPVSAAAFRNLGSAYHATGNTQMAFASYQQAIQLDPKDALVYLKLAFFYEEFASMDWNDAADHAMQCYSYYLDNVDQEDTAVLTRLGNLQVREHRSEEAIATYTAALKSDSSLANVWFNLAHAQVKAGDTAGASESLLKTLSLDPSITAASHMLKAFSPSESVKVSQSDDAYIRDLFDSYSTTYDPHVKKLLYSAPRVIRQELAKIYKGRFTIDPSVEETVPMNLPSEQPGCTTIIPTITINSTLEVLDLGCGTGLAGAWLKDYAKVLVGVDLSEQMITIAKKKMLYQELSVMSISTYLQRCTRSFDLVVCADVLSYIGDLQKTFAQVVPVLRKGGHFVFTVEGLEGNKDFAGGEDKKGFTLLQSGR